jgi:hypothetical protein
VWEEERVYGRKRGCMGGREGVWEEERVHVFLCPFDAFRLIYALTLSLSLFVPVRVHVLLTCISLCLYFSMLFSFFFHSKLKFILHETSLSLFLSTIPIKKFCVKTNGYYFTEIAGFPLSLPFYFLYI